MNYLIPILILLMGCSKSDKIKSIPDCINQKIEMFSTRPVCDYSSVEEYVFQNNQVYVFDNQRCCCDVNSEVFNSDCVLLGYLGGFVGNFTINGEDFQNAKLVRTLWKPK